ncbi:MAG: Bug family tripartite tricarboxylate transporter substrate binding protein [Burkholderiales bacterium]
MKTILQPLAIFALALFHSGVFAQSWPAKPIQVISATGLGNPGDTALRLIAPKMTEALGQPIVIETRAGGSGTIAYTAVARAAPDGYSIAFGTSSLATLRYLLKNPPVDPQKDFTPVSLVARSPSVFAVTASLPVKSVKEFVDYAKKNPGKLSFVHTGVGAGLHLIGESLNQHAGINMLAIAYKQSGGTMTNDFLTGRVPVYFSSLGTMRPFHVEGRARIIAVVNDKRFPQMGDIPTINETLPDFYNVIPWWAFLGPAGMPNTIAERFAAETRKALDDPAVTAKVEASGAFIVAGTPSEFAAHLKRETEFMGGLIRSLGIVPE